MDFMTKGGTELGCMSTSANQQIAASFAGLDGDECKCPLIFKFTTKDFISVGADIRFLSVYPEEKEFLYPPLTYLRPISLTKEEICGKNVVVASVEPVLS